MSNITRQDVEQMLLKRMGGASKKFSYCGNWKTNLLSIKDRKIEKRHFYYDLLQGDGSELFNGIGKSPKFNSITSSTALAVNTFAPWKDYLSELIVPLEKDESGFEICEFEHIAENGLQGKSPNLDVWLEKSVNNGVKKVVAIESKFCEFIDNPKAKKPVFQDSYHELIKKEKDLFSESVWAEYIKVVKGSNKGTYEFKYLGVEQLVKHYFGLKYSLKDDEKKEIHLLYVYWRPINNNWQETEPYKTHQEEISRFKDQIRGSTDVRFQSISYQDLWRKWRDKLESRTFKNHSLIEAHIVALEKRYNIKI